jgi:lipid II:glycine glycyltransferase (peptidoglycan interpeptide bridge formation enzyme)
MNCFIEEKEIEEIFETKILQQTTFWAKVKNEQGLHPIAFNFEATADLLSPLKSENTKIENDLLVLIQYVNSNACFAYVPYGPTIQPDFENYGVFLEEFSETLKPYLPKECMFIRYDLPWENQWAKEDDYVDENGYWMGPPPVSSQEFRVNFNTQNWNLHKSPSNILPTNTYFLNLNQPKDDLLMKMKPKTRYNIKLSQRKGVQVKEYGMDMLDVWYEIYKDTAARNGLTLHSKNYFYTLLLQQQNQYDSDVRLSLLMADYNGEFLAAQFLILSKNRGTYLYGASSSNKRHLMASYALQWEAMQIARKNGCTEYDMFGTAPNASSTHPLHGLYRFKSGFGGELFHRMGCWDYPLIENDYLAFKALEVNNQKYHSC